MGQCEGTACCRTTEEKTQTQQYHGFKLACGHKSCKECDWNCIHDKRRGIMMYEC